MDKRNNEIVVVFFSTILLFTPISAFALTPVADLTGDWSGTGQEKWYYDFSESNSSFNENIFDLVCTGDWGLKVAIKQNGNNLDIQVNGKLTKAIDHIRGFDCEEEEAGAIFSESLKGTIDGSKITVFDPAHGKLLGTYTSAGIKIEGTIPDEEGYLVYKLQIKPNFSPPKIGTEEDPKEDVTPETTAKPEPKITTETTTGLKKCQSLHSEGKLPSEINKCLRNLNLNTCELTVYFKLITGSTVTSDCQGTIKFGDIQISAGKNTKYKLSKVDTPLITMVQGKIKIISDFIEKDSKPKLKIQTPTVSLGVRFTEFIVDYDPSSNITTVILLEGTIDATTDGETRTFSGENKFIADSSGIIQTEPFSISEWNSLANEIEPKEIIDVQDADKARTFDDIQIIGGTNSYRTNEDTKESDIVPRVFTEGGKFKIIYDPIDEVSSKPKLNVHTSDVTIIVREAVEFIVDYDPSSKLSTILLLEGSIDMYMVGRTYTFSGEDKFIVDGTRFGTITPETFSISEWNDLSAEIESKGIIDDISLEVGGCLIATATYGSEMAPQVQMLREIRDNKLLQTNSGSAFMESFNSIYYSFSPTVADWERHNPVFKETVKIAITPMIATLSILNYVDIDSEIDVLGYGISLILLNVGMYFVVPVTVIYRIKKILNS